MSTAGPPRGGRPRNAQRGGVAADAALPRRPLPPSALLGMWVFIASEVMFFGALLAAYLAARIRWPGGFAAASRHTHVLLGTANTAVLLTSSAVMALAVACARQPAQRRRTPRLLIATALLGGVFLAIKAAEYVMEWHEGLFPGPAFPLHEAGADLFFALYFLTTSLHAVHLAIGIGAVLVVARLAAAGPDRAPPERVEALALYWHFVDVVWIFLYPFLYLVDRHP